MAIPTREDLRTLLDTRDGQFVSIYAPMIRAGEQVRQNPIRFRNCLDEAQTRLEGLGMRASEARQLLSPGAELLNNWNFWQRQSDGLAVFIADGFFRPFTVPLPVKDLTSVSQHFYLKPLLPVFSGDGQYYLLALSKKEVRLLQGTHYSVERIDLANVPHSLSEVLKFDVFERQIQLHSAGPVSTTGRRSVMFHGHGEGTDEARTQLLRYFQEIDRGMREFLGAQHAPLVLAADEHLQGIYREANRYQWLAEDGVAGSPHQLRDDELHERAWRVAEPIFRARRDRDATQFKHLIGTHSPQASNALEQIVPAAAQGRVDRLFVALGLEKWGLYAPEENKLELHDQRQNLDEDLLDLAAVRTLSAGGTVYSVSPEEVPFAKAAAAIFRY